MSGPGMRHTLWCIWILCVALLISLVDTKPDPPALDAHSAALKARSASERATIACEPFVRSLPALVAFFPGHTSVQVPEHTPDCLTSIIAEMGQAADSSPPAGQAVSNPEA